MQILPSTGKHKGRRPGIKAGRLSVKTAQILESESVFWHGGIYLVRPCEDAALQVEDLAETRFTQKVHRLGRTLAAAAMRDDFPRGIQLVHAARQLAERNQMSMQIADLVFVRLAHIQNEKIVSAIETRLQ